MQINQGLQHKFVIPSILFVFMQVGRLDIQAEKKTYKRMLYLDKIWNNVLDEFEAS